MYCCIALRWVYSLQQLLYCFLYHHFYSALFSGCLAAASALCPPRQLLGAIGRFSAYSLLGAGLSAVLLIPTYFSLRLTSAADDAFPSAVTHYFDLFDYIGQHFMLVPLDHPQAVCPTMYSGVLTLILIPIFLSGQVSFPAAEIYASGFAADYDSQL
jgi:uncharacterized membrane protein YfhO